jgi:hypothetical protein
MQIDGLACPGFVSADDYFDLVSGPERQVIQHNPSEGIYGCFGDVDTHKVRLTNMLRAIPFWRMFMRIDWYTKGVLTVSALLLAVIALRPFVSPWAPQGSFAGVQFSGGATEPQFFDARTGELWGYGHW